MTDLRTQIEQIIESEPVALFMKGTPAFAACGNSQRALSALRGAGAPVTAVDILPNPALPPGALRPLGLADDPADLRQG